MKFVDMHCDTITALLAKKEKGSTETLLHNTGHIDLTRLKQGDYLLQNFAIFTNLKYGNPFDFCQKALAFYQQEISRYPQLIRPVVNYQQIEENIRDGIMSSLLTLEEGAVINNDLHQLDDYYAQGVRMITLTWNYPNGIGYPNFVPYEGADGPTLMHTFDSEHGLTEFGFDYVRKMNDLGMIVDVSHLSDKGFADVCQAVQGPFVASHSNARQICGVSRNLTDDMIVQLADHGGVMGLNYCTAFINEEADKTYMEDMVRHVKHILNVGGTEVLGLGSDFDGIEPTLELTDCSQMPRFEERLLESGLTFSEVEKITHQNVLRVYREKL